MEQDKLGKSRKLSILSRWGSKVLKVRWGSKWKLFELAELGDTP